MPPQAAKTVMIVDDHPVVREGIRFLLERDGEFVVIAEASDRTDALAATGTAVPDVVLVDVALRGADGLDLTRALRSRHPRLPILVVSMHDEALYAERALNAGANGYLMKDAMADTVVDAVRRVLQGDVVVSARITQRMLRAATRSGARPTQSPVDKLSDRELEVLRHIGEGMGTRAIARSMHLSVKTIETHRAHLKEKLALADANELLRYAANWLAARTQ